MADCIFCQIVAGKIPCHKIYEDAKCLAFLDIFPSVYAHTLIIPKKHYRWVWDMEVPGDLLNVAQKITKHYQAILKVETCFANIYGINVSHAHLHVKPVPSGSKEDFGMTPSGSGQLTEADGKAMSNRLRLPDSA